MATTLKLGVRVGRRLLKMGRCFVMTTIGQKGKSEHADD